MLGVPMLMQFIYVLCGSKKVAEKLLGFKNEEEALQQDIYIIAQCINQYVEQYTASTLAMFGYCKKFAKKLRCIAKIPILFGRYPRLPKNDLKVIDIEALLLPLYSLSRAALQ